MFVFSKKIELHNNFDYQEIESLLKNRFNIKFTQSLTGRKFLVVKNKGLRHFIYLNENIITVKTYPPYWWPALSVMIPIIVFIAAVNIISSVNDNSKYLAISLLLLSFIITLILYPVLFKQKSNKFCNNITEIFNAHN